MRYLNPPNPSPQTDYFQNSTPDYAAMITVLATRLTVLQAQVETVQNRVDSLEFHQMRPFNQTFTPETTQTQYSPIVQAAFKSMKWLFLFLAGFALACILSVGLRTPNSITSTLLDQLQFWLLPLAVLVFAIVVIAAVLESLK